MTERLREAFDQVRAEEELKARTREFLLQKIESSQKKVLFSARRLAAVAACMMLLFGGGWFTYFTPAYAISVDVNPSFELEINRFDKVVSVEAYNQDAYRLTSSLDVRYLDYRDALEQILSDPNMEVYLVQDQPVSVTVFGADEKKNDEMLANVTACTSSYLNVHCACASREEVSAAHESGMSFGKYRAFLELQALDPDVTAEEVQALTMCQIQGRIESLSGSTGSGTSHHHAEGEWGNHDAGHGHGHGGENQNTCKGDN